MKFGLILQGPAEVLTERARKINSSVPIIVVDENTYKDPELFAVFAFRNFRRIADDFNARRLNQNLPQFSVMDFPLPQLTQSSRTSVRQRISEILREGPAYGYGIFKKYCTRYGKISMRLIYYHLARGEKDGLFEVSDLKQEKGDFSWGEASQRKYYKLKFSGDYQSAQNRRKPE
jgi:DNA-binding PadR family transcriptional regulator